MSGAFACSPSGIACIDGKELLVYEPADEAPAWKKTRAAKLTHVAIMGDLVLAIDDTGDLVRYDAESGDEIGKTAFHGGAHALAVGAGGVYAVALDESVEIVDGDARRAIAIAGARALALSSKLVAIGTEDGKVHVRDGETTVAVADIGAPIRGLARHPAGFWLATAGDKVFRIGDDGEVATFTRAADCAPSAVSVSRDGSMIGLVIGPKTAIALAYPSKDTLLSVTYQDRKALGVEFTDDGRFAWVGMDKGDANKIDLENEDVYRTDPHPGRTRTTWLLIAHVDKAVRARAKAAAAEGEAKKPGVVSATSQPPPADAAEKKPLGRPEPFQPPSPEAHKRLVLAVLVIASALAFLSLKCG